MRALAGAEALICCLHPKNKHLDIDKQQRIAIFLKGSSPEPAMVEETANFEDTGRESGGALKSAAQAECESGL
jgi:hypothetical protein